MCQSKELLIYLFFYVRLDDWTKKASLTVAFQHSIAFILYRLLLKEGTLTSYDCWCNLFSYVVRQDPRGAK